MSLDGTKCHRITYHGIASVGGGVCAVTIGKGRMTGIESLWDFGTTFLHIYLAGMAACLRAPACVASVGDDKNGIRDSRRICDR